MTETKTPAAPSVRWAYLVTGVIAMLFAGVIYAWSILKAPFSNEFGWNANQLALNFTLTMCCFCLGGLLGSMLSKRLGFRVALFVAAVLGCAGFLLTSTLTGGSVALLYVFYAVLAGLGIGVAYNVTISTVSRWFPDKKGLCSGCLMMGFGASALVLGNLANGMFASAGWRTTYLVLGVALGVIIAAAALILRAPGADTVLPEARAKAAGKENFEVRDLRPGEMLRRPSFWMAFVALVFLSAVGSSVISFAKDLALSVGAAESLAVTLVGVLSVCNGLGRILTGAVFDAIGRRKTMLAANILTIAAAGVTLLSVFVSSLPLCIVGLCLTGMSYGSCPTRSERAHV